MKSFSDKLTTGPEGSGSVTGSLLMTCCCMMLSRTRVISAHAQNSIYVLFQTMGGGLSHVICLIYTPTKCSNRSADKPQQNRLAFTCKMRARHFLVDTGVSIFQSSFWSIS